MGDRANIVLDYGHDKKIFLYTHWGGSELPQTLAYALTRGKERWCDESYLSRIIFSEMVRDNIDDLTGFGIAPYEVDNEHQYLVVDLEALTVNGTPFPDFIADPCFNEEQADDEQEAV